MIVHEELMNYLRRVLGPCRIEADRSWPRHGPCVLQVTDADGTTWYAKRHRHRANYEREVEAYLAWVPALEDRAPRMPTHDDDLLALVLSAVPGTVAAEAAADDVDVHHRAGALLRRFHSAEPPSPWPDVAPEKGAELERLVSGSDGLLERREVDFARAELRALAELDVPQRIPCHLDYTPRNRLVDAGDVRVIDFEWASPDVWINDIGRLFFGWWRGRPDLGEAFLAGYGRVPDADDHAMMVASHALTTVRNLIFARAYGDRGRHWRRYPHRQVM